MLTTWAVGSGAQSATPRPGERNSRGGLWSRPPGCAGAVLMPPGHRSAYGNDFARPEPRPGASAPTGRFPAHAVPGAAAKLGRRRPPVATRDGGDARWLVAKRLSRKVWVAEFRSELPSSAAIPAHPGSGCVEGDHRCREAEPEVILEPLSAANKIYRGSSARVRRVRDTRAPPTEAPKSPSAYRLGNRGPPPATATAARILRNAGPRSACPEAATWHLARSAAPARPRPAASVGLPRRRACPPVKPLVDVTRAPACLARR